MVSKTYTGLAGGMTESVFSFLGSVVFLVVFSETSLLVLKGALLHPDRNPIRMIADIEISRIYFLLIIALINCFRRPILSCCLVLNVPYIKILDSDKGHMFTR
jgi:hypothetical protein